MNRNVLKAIAAAAAFTTMIACSTAQVPVVNIDPSRHGNLAAAQELVLQAFDRLSDAQQANNSQLGGHAARAKELLREANEEIKAAAITANSRW